VSSSFSSSYLSSSGMGAYNTQSSTKPLCRINIQPSHDPFRDEHAIDEDIESPFSHPSSSDDEDYEEYEYDTFSLLPAHAPILKKGNTKTNSKGNATKSVPRLPLFKRPGGGEYERLGGNDGEDQGKAPKVMKDLKSMFGSRKTTQKNQALEPMRGTSMLEDQKMKIGGAWKSQLCDRLARQFAAGRGGN
jgi:hypothetical protein